jgi:hypothetical protein
MPQRPLRSAFPVMSNQKTGVILFRAVYPATKLRAMTPKSAAGSLRFAFDTQLDTSSADYNK